MLPMVPMPITGLIVDRTLRESAATVKATGV